ncbi:MAG: hypothetical protein CVU11_06770 [Bacteroidetes bacterium HGW-Bacteroidetes-6]|jgi:outer membrane protein|nr:MAG: hypothetical protein CVU11_06770 [Bacteroidetes bacterium HGW-Bacteroidetes-6]
MKTKLFLAALFLLSSVWVSAQKFAYVDTQYILENIPDYQTAQNTLDEISIEWQKELEGKFAEIDQLYKSFQSEAFLLSEDMKTKRQNEIIAKEKEAKELQKKYFGTEGDLYKKRQELIKPIQDKVYNAIEELAEEGSYAIIFDRSGSTTIIYASEKFDKSDDVLAKLGYKAGGVSQ